MINMKIELNVRETMGISEFAETHGLTMVVTERPPHIENVEKFYANFKNADVAVAGGRVSCFGNGDTPEEAIRNYAARISCKTLVINARKDVEKRIEVPKLTYDIPDEELSELQEAEPDKVIEPFFRLLLSKMDGSGPWSLISNPSWDIFSKSADTILHNAVNEYVEYKNCGVAHRMIRVSDADKYGIHKQDLRIEFTLDPREA